MLIVSITNILVFENSEENVFLIIERVCLGEEKELIAKKIVTKFLILFNGIKKNKLEISKKNKIKNELHLYFHHLKKKRDEIESTFPTYSENDCILQNLEYLELEIESLTEKNILAYKHGVLENMIRFENTASSNNSQAFELNYCENSGMTTNAYPTQNNHSKFNSEENASQDIFSFEETEKEEKEKAEIVEKENKSRGSKRNIFKTIINKHNKEKEKEPVNTITNTKTTDVKSKPSNRGLVMNMELIKEEEEFNHEMFNTNSQGGKSFLKATNSKKMIQTDRSNNKKEDTTEEKEQKNKNSVSGFEIEDNNKKNN